MKQVTTHQYEDDLERKTLSILTGSFAREGAKIYDES